ncbi:uncharacterized protein LOC143181404 [Calliopsis andreniformis]|uniref:uncharacterized protein LOC143181404 n=1 Tax=Calliopsis andreniformis TaxID=337506 RepID=UPI003FCE00C8
MKKKEKDDRGQCSQIGRSYERRKSIWKENRREGGCHQAHPFIMKFTTNLTRAPRVLLENDGLMEFWLDWNTEILALDEKRWRVQTGTIDTIRARVFAKILPTLYIGTNCCNNFDCIENRRARR